MKKRVLKTQKPKVSETEINRSESTSVSKKAEKIINLVEQKVLDKIHDDHWKKKMQEWESKKNK
jgi:hypothetical protein